MQNWFPACQFCLSMPLYLQPLLFQSKNCIAKQLASQLTISSSSNFVQRQVYIDKNFISGSFYQVHSCCFTQMAAS